MNRSEKKKKPVENQKWKKVFRKKKKARRVKYDIEKLAVFYNEYQFISVLVLVITLHS